MGHTRKRNYDRYTLAEKQIKKLERELANRNDEIDLLKKAERFFQRKK
jgi:transposase